MTDYANRPAHAVSSRRVSGMALTAILLAGLLFACGCGGGDDGGSAEAGEPLGVTMPTKLTFSMTNNTKDTLEQVMIEGFEQNVKFTSIASGGTRSLLGMKPMDMATDITVSWSTPRGSGRRSASVDGSLPDNFNGTLYFTISGASKVSLRPGTVSAN